MNLFKAKINNWDDWGKVYQSIPDFAPLAEYILQKENLPAAKLEHLTPGTNAVFRAGDYVIKMYAPPESGLDQSLDLQSELFSVRRANALGVLTPRLVAEGFVEDKYRFAYLIMEYIEGEEFCEAVKKMTEGEKITAGRKLREITDRLNTPCEAFNGIDAINNKDRWERWNRYPESFKAEREAYIKTHSFGEKVFVHGDLCGDNILISPEGEFYIIDFADSLLAPAVYEHALMVFVFKFDLALLLGYFGDYNAAKLVEICFNGLLIHDFGGDIAAERLGEPAEFKCLEDLRKMLREKIDTLKAM